jgi:hypothetical protein
MNLVNLFLSSLVRLFFIFFLLENAKSKSFLAVEVFLFAAKWLLWSVALYRVFVFYFLNSNVEGIDCLRLTSDGRGTLHASWSRGLACCSFGC